MDPVVRAALESLAAHPELVRRHIACCHERDLVLSYLMTLRAHGHRYDVQEVMEWFCEKYGIENCASIRRWVELTAWGGRPTWWRQQFSDPDEIERGWREDVEKLTHA